MKIKFAFILVLSAIAGLIVLGQPDHIIYGVGNTLLRIWEMPVVPARSTNALVGKQFEAEGLPYTAGALKQFALGVTAATDSLPQSWKPEDFVITFAISQDGTNWYAPPYLRIPAMLSYSNRLVVFTNVDASSFQFIRINSFEVASQYSITNVAVTVYTK